MHVLRSEREDNHLLKAARHVKIVSAFVLCLLLRVCSGPQIEPMADDVITRYGIGSLVSLVYICGMNRNFGNNLFSLLSSNC